MSSSKVRHVDRYFDEYIAGTFGQLTFEEHGAYNCVIDMISSAEGPIPVDYERFAHAGKASQRTARRLIKQLLTKGKLKLTDDGKLTNGRAIIEVAKASKRISDAQTAAKLAGNSHKTRAEQRRNSRNINGPSEPAGAEQQPPTEQPPTSSEGEKSARARATPPANGAVSRATLIPDDWQPSTETVAKLRRSRPDLVGSFYDLELLKFRMWAASNAVLTHRIEASFIGYMIKARLAPRQTEEERDAEFQRVLRTLKEKRQ